MKNEFKTTECKECGIFFAVDNCPVCERDKKLKDDLQSKMGMIEE